jgi:hypothetical protein
MKHQRHFENVDRTAVREAATIENMIADLQRVVEVLDCDVSTEEERTRVRDCSDARYPMLARNLAARRDNLRVTIAALEARLSSTSANVRVNIASAA